MFDSLSIKIPAGMAKEQALAQIAAAREKGIEGALGIIKAKVIDLTPRYKGGLQSHIYDRQPDSFSGEVYTSGVVAAVHERNAVWSKYPPIEPLRGWVMGKLGVDEKRSKSVAFLVARKIRRFGLTLPNKEGKGQMFARTREFMARSGGHFRAFVSGMRQALAGLLGGEA